MSEDEPQLKPRKAAIRFDAVARDLQWRRRCQQEEMQCLDAYAGPPSKKKAKVFQERAQHFHSNGARIVFKNTQQQQTPRNNADFTTIQPQQQEQKPALDKESTMPPRSQVSVKESILQSEFSYFSKKTTQTTRDKMDIIRFEIQKEREARLAAERQMQSLTNSKEGGFNNY